MNLSDHEMPQILRQYLTHMQTIRGKSPKTVEEYYLDLRTFFRYMLMKKNGVTDDFEKIDIMAVDIDFIRGITLSDCYDYLFFVAENRENHAAARARKVSSLKSFFNFLQQKAGLITENPVKELDFPKQKKALPVYLNLDESLRLLESVGSKHSVRDYCIVTLFLNCGMRLSELVGLNINDYNAKDHTLRLLGKGNKERIIYTNDACDQALAEWLKIRPNYPCKDKNALFVSRKQNRISPKTIQWLLPKLFSAADLDGRGFSAHKLRHTAATLMYQQGDVDVRLLQLILGHKSLATTEIYTHVANAELQSAAQANPLASVKPPKPDEKDTN